MLFRSSRLMKYTMPSDRTAPVVEAALTPPDPRPGQSTHVRLSASDDVTRHPRIHYRVGEGDWEIYTRPVLVQPDETMHYRAVDAAGNASEIGSIKDRKSTRLNSSHVAISYAVFCLKKKKK